MPSPTTSDDDDAAALLILNRMRANSSLPPQPMTQVPDKAKAQKLATLLRKSP